MTVAILLPARLASSRLPHKLLLDRSGKTVLEHTIDRAKEAQAASEGMISRIIVAADCRSLMTVADNAGVESVLTDPKHASGTDRIAEAACRINDEIIVNLQADEPEIDPASILLVAKLLTAPGESASMATLAEPIFDAETFQKSNVVKVVASASGYALYFSRAPIPFLRDAGTAQLCQMDGKPVYGLHHIGIYAYRRAFLLLYKNLPCSKLEELEKLEQLRALEAGYAIKLGMVKNSPLGIDTAEDYEAFIKRMAVSGKNTRSAR